MGDAEPNATNTIYLAIPATSEGFEISGGWDVLGMRGTVSRNLEFTEVFVPSDAALLPTGKY